LDAHDHRIPVAAQGEAVVAQATFFQEAALAIAGDGARIPLVDVQRHAVQVHLVEREAQQGDDRVRAVAVAPAPSRR
jgi:hypothetical protein